MRGALSLIVILVLWTAAAFADTYLVRPDGGGDFATIQAALEAVAEGDVIELSDGTFSGPGNRDIDFLGKAVTVRSQGGDPTLCIVDCRGSESDMHRGFLFVSGEGRGAVLQGITITGGYHDVGGCGIRCVGSSPTIRACILSHNGGCYWEGGAGLSCEGGAPRLEDCQFLQNTTHYFSPAEVNGNGAGLLCTDSSPEVVRCTFAGNVVAHGFDTCGNGGGIASYGSDLVLEDCWFHENEGHWGGMCNSFGPALYVRDSTVLATGCLFAGNYGDYEAAVFSRGTSSASFLSCTFSGNVAPGPVLDSWEDSDYWLEDTIIAFTRAPYGDWPYPPVRGSGDVTLTGCDLYGNHWGDWIGELAGLQYRDGNFSADPCFCDTTALDWHLCADSWCAPENHPWGWDRLVGALEVGCAACDCPQPVAAGGPPDLAGGRLAAHLEAVSPNPFNPRTEIVLRVVRSTRARIAVHDLAGKLVAILADETFAAGRHRLTWDARDRAGRAVAAGIYVLRLEVAGGSTSRKIAVLK
jgi:hypothetical protein